MAPDPNLEGQLRDFDDQRYPTVEQTIVNNASVLYKRKKYFLQDLRQSVNGILYIFNGLIFLKDMSVLCLACRCFIQHTIHHPSVGWSIIENKKSLMCFTILRIIFLNLVFLVVHVISGVYQKEHLLDNYLHGWITIQFIGEGPPSSRYSLVILDLCTFFLQLAYHSLVLCTDDSEVLQTRRPDMNLDGDDYYLNRLESEGDGYTGNVSLIKLDLVKNFMEVFDSENYGKIDPGPFVGRGPAGSSFV
ncbi:hypothetical protein HYPBUDRAFT_152394 [Hyphopichia burtonii NRRL Y-1933]|uniref:DUF1746 domain-containing protein n=1 Tax=Hyphopichia burtonii NRRL Y-1933 TaxID=984485 RepID=A0A1E4RJN7_9ASCO|nr:hypothetical protein HYPBUDRAFT_152394 [Hyphopichia burtonii NRRL Y-1933]ODV67463.1 hypothetical protein HYPBUDRAFT_152394 [Hyphopichia burtonii NRRL Y-1933]